MSTDTHYFAIVTFGSPTTPRRSYYRSLAAARADAAGMKGTGSCTTVRIYECETLALARSADISELRKGGAHRVVELTAPVTQETP